MKPKRAVFFLIFFLNIYYIFVILRKKDRFMKKIFYIVLSLMMFATSAEAKHYIITVENNTRAPVNWDSFVSRSGGAVVEKYDFIDGALLDLSEEQVSRLRDNRVPGMTIEEDRLIRLILEKKPSAKN